MMAERQAVSDAPANVVVVAADGERLGQYESALQQARVQMKATLDADEAETLVADLSPDVLVLDRGLPRLVLFRLYGLAREDAGESQVKIVFVGQEGDTGPDDHYLPGEPSPSTVAERVAQLLPSAAAQPEAVVAPRAEPAAPVHQVAPHAVDTDADSVEAPAVNTASSVATATAAVPVAAGAPAADVVAEGDEAAAVDGPTRAGRGLDVVLIRIGLVLLILGALLVLIQSDAFPPAVMAPSTPAARP